MRFLQSIRPRLLVFAKLSSALLILAVGLAAAACSRGQRTAADSGKTAVFAIGAEPSGINRNLSSSNADGLIACIVYQGLVDVHADGSIAPLLAKSWTVADGGRTYDFQLNKANWTDGKPFTSDDVKYTLLQISAKYSAVFAGAAKVIDGIDTPAPDRVVIRLKKPYGPFLLSLGCSQGGAILPAHVFRGTNVAMNPAVRAPVGTGAFKLERWEPGQYLRLTRNQDYWEPGKPYLDEVIATILPQAGARTQALLARELDFVTFTLLPVNDYGLLQRSALVKLIPSPVPAIDVAVINTSRPQLSDKRVRQALMMATDREYLLKTAYHGVGAVGSMPFTNRIKWAANDSIDYARLYPFNPARANALLDQAGLRRNAAGSRFSVTMNYFAEDQDAALAATAIKSMWRRVGVDVDIIPGERVSLVQKIFVKRDFDLALLSYNSNGDPALGLSRLFQSSAIGQVFGNPSGYANPQVDKALAAGQSSADFAVRGAAYAQAQTILATDLPVLTLHERVTDSAVSAKLAGMDEEYYLPTWRNARFIR